MRFLRLAPKLVLALVGSALLLEGGVRLRQWLRYGTTEGYYRLVEDPATGLQIPEPGVVVGPIHVNSLGFRGPELEVPKPAGRLRVGFLGGSTTFCAEASSDDAVWPARVVAELRERYPDVEFDYVNGASAGYSTVQSLTNLRERVAPHEPDVLVIYHATNDLTQESRRLAAAEGRYDENRRETSRLGEHWLTLALVEKNVNYYLRQRTARAERDPFRPDVEELAEPFRERLTALAEECKTVASVVVLPTFCQQARREQMPNELLRACSSSLYYMPFMNPRALLDAFERYNDVIRDVGTATGVILVEGEDDVPADTRYFRDSVHFTDEGCRLMAKRVWSALVGSPEFEALIEEKRTLLAEHEPSQ